MAAELGLDVKQARRAGLLHDIGKALTHEVDGSHAVIGADLCEKYGESPEIVHAIRAHHEDVKPENWLDFLVIGSDAISGARPGARREQLENYVRRIEDLERISNAHPGVERTFAVAAGREVRVMVENSKINDEQAVILSREIAKKIEQDMTYPGQIKVTVIRETRAVSVAK
jgi:ribonuclease Y